MFCSCKNHPQPRRSVHLTPNPDATKRPPPYVCHDAGHIAEDATLAAVANRILAVARTVAFYDDGVNALREVDAPEESVIHTTVIGII